MVLLKVKKT